MTSSFNPPPVERLKEVETAECEYKDGLVEIEGVVSAGGQGGWPHSDDYEVHCFALAAWRLPGESVVERELTILRPASPDDDWYAEFPKLSIQRIQVLMSTDDTRAIFAAKSTQPAERRGMEEIAAKLALPVKVQTEQFGELTLNRSINWFMGKAQWNGQLVDISFETDDDHNISMGLKVAESLWSDQQAWKDKVDAFAVQELLPLKNDDWLDDDETPVTAKQFKDLMTLKTITIGNDGNFEFWHDDGDLFWGHSIQVCGSLTDGLSHADIPG